MRVVQEELDTLQKNCDNLREELRTHLVLKERKAHLELLVDSTPVQAVAAAVRLGYRCTAGTMVIGDPKPGGSKVTELTHLVLEDEGEDVLSAIWDALRPGTMLWRNPTVNYRPFIRV